LHFRDVGLVLERVGRRGGALRVRTDRDAELLRIDVLASASNANQSASLVSGNRISPVGVFVLLGPKA